jgi:hypothetical protein
MERVSVAQRSLSRSAAVRVVGVSAVLGGVALLGGSSALVSVAKGAALGAGGFALLAVGGAVLLRRRLWTALALTNMAKHAVQLCSQFIVDREPLLRRELALPHVHGVLLSTRPHGDEGAALFLEFALHASPAPAPAAPPSGVAAFVVRFVSEDEVAVVTPTTPVAHIVDATLRVERDGRLVDLGAPAAAAPGEPAKKAAAIDVDFVDLSQNKKR